MDLPDPDGPASATSSPGSTRSETSCSTSTRPVARAVPVADLDQLERGHDSSSGARRRTPSPPISTITRRDGNRSSTVRRQLEPAGRVDDAAVVSRRVVSLESTPWRSRSSRSARCMIRSSWLLITTAAPAAAAREQRVDDQVGVGVVELGGRLVGDDQGGRADQGERDGEPLLLAAGQRRRAGGRPGARARPRRAPRPGGRPSAPRQAADLAELVDGAQVREDRLRRALRHEADPAPAQRAQLPGGGRADVAAEHGEPAGARPVAGAQQREQAALAAAGRAGDDGQHAGHAPPARCRAGRGSRRSPSGRPSPGPRRSPPGRSGGLSLRHEAPPQGVGAAPAGRRAARRAARSPTRTPTSTTTSATSGRGRVSGGIGGGRVDRSSGRAPAPRRRARRRRRPSRRRTPTSQAGSGPARASRSPSGRAARRRPRRGRPAASASTSAAGHGEHEHHDAEREDVPRRPGRGDQPAADRAPRRRSPRPRRSRRRRRRGRARRSPAVRSDQTARGERAGVAAAARPRGAGRRSAARSRNSLPALMITVTSAVSDSEPGERRHDADDLERDLELGAEVERALVARRPGRCRRPGSPAAPCALPASSGSSARPASRSPEAPQSATSAKVSRVDRHHRLVAERRAAVRRRAATRSSCPSAGGVIGRRPSAGRGSPRRPRSS